MIRLHDIFMLSANHFETVHVPPFQFQILPIIVNIFELLRFIVLNAV